MVHDRIERKQQGSYWSVLLSRAITTLLVGYLAFQLSSVSYNWCYSILADSPRPTSRGIAADRIGLSLSLAGIAHHPTSPLVVRLKPKYGFDHGLDASNPASRAPTMEETSAPMTAFAGPVWCSRPRRLACDAT